MNEKEKMSTKFPFHFNNYYREKFFNKEFKILTPNKSGNLIIKGKNTNKMKLKQNNCPYINKRNINESSPFIKFSTSNFFPPLVKKDNKSLKKIDSQKKLIGIDNYMTNGFKIGIKNENNQLFKITKKICLKEIIKGNNNSKFKARNFNDKVFGYYSKIEENKNNSFLKKNTIENSFQYNNIATIKCCNIERNISIRKNTEEKSKSPKLKLTKSYDKCILNKKINDEEKNNFLKKNSRFNSNEIYNKKKMMYKYCVYPGNNSKLIDLVMKEREDIWEKVPTNHYRYCDMVWAPLTSNIDFKTCQFMHSYVNHIPLNEEISNKMRLYANLIRHCEKKKIDVYKIFPFTIILTLSHHTFGEQIENFKVLFKDIDSFTPKSDVHFSKLFNALLNRRIGSNQTINIPKTFNSGKNMWIIKPVNLNRGRCIKVLNNLSSILKEMKLIQTYRKINILENNSCRMNLNKNFETINTNCKNNSPEKDRINSIRCEYIMIQKYLEKPLLYQGRKFDIRIWVMFISNRDNEIFIFKEGHLKAASLKYDSDSNDLFIHLTNYSVQKHHTNFSEKEIGNEIPFYDFQYELDRNHSKINFKKDIYPKIVRIIRLTGGAAKKGKMNFMNFKNCFEIFGYDFILDEYYIPYLLEVNSNPGLEFSSPLIKQLLPRMIDDAFRLTIDEEYSMGNIFINQSSNFPVDYHKNSENLWERYTIL